MKFTPKNSIEKFQMGGQVAPEQAPAEGAAAPVEGAGTPAPEGEQGDPLMQVAQLAAQALQNQDCNAAMQVCQIFLQMVQQMAGQAEPKAQGEPVFRKGGVLVRRVKK